MIPVSGNQLQHNAPWGIRNSINTAAPTKEEVHGTTKAADQLLPFLCMLLPFLCMLLLFQAAASAGVMSCGRW
jgi:hypothetical protein